MKGAFLKHKMYRDVCFRVLTHYSVHNRAKLKIEWWNLGCVNSSNMGYRQNTEILYSDYPNWEYTYDMPASLRTANWKQLTNG